jgi:hypothetical protein
MKSTTATQRNQRTRRASIALAGGPALALMVGLSLGLWQVHGHSGRAGSFSPATIRVQQSGFQSVPSARPMGGEAEFLQAQQVAGTPQDRLTPSGGGLEAAPFGFAGDGRPLGGHAEWLQYLEQTGG